MIGLLRKRWFVSLKKLKIQGIQWLIACGIILATIILSHSLIGKKSGSSGVKERLQIDLSIYGNTKVFYGGNVVNLEDTYGNIVKDYGSHSVKSILDVNSGNSLRFFEISNN